MFMFGFFRGRRKTYGVQNIKLRQALRRFKQKFVYKFIVNEVK